MPLVDSKENYPGSLGSKILSENIQKPVKLWPNQSIQKGYTKM